MFDGEALIPWARKHTLHGRNGPHGRSNCVEFVLCHLPADGTVTQLDAVDASTEEGFGGALCVRFADAADAFCESIGGVQRFKINAVFEGRDVEPFAHHFKHGKPSTAASGDERYDTEPATEKGLLSMTMRHLEATQRGTFGLMERTLVQLSRTNEAQSETISRLVKDRMDAFAEVEDMRSEKAEREVKFRSADARAKVIGNVGDQLAGMIPLVVRGIAQRALGQGPTSDAGVAATIATQDSWFESLTKEQVTQIAQGMSPIQAGAFFAMLEDYYKRREAKEKAATDSPVEVKTEAL